MRENFHYKEKIKDFILLFFITFSIRFIPALSKSFLSPDACLYLNMGKNFFEGRGFVITYNFSHFWKTLSYPAALFIHPLYSFFAGFVFFLFKSLKMVTFLNIFIAYLNLILIFYLFPFSKRVRYFICILASFNYTFFYTSLFPWTEQLHLSFLLVSFYFLKKFSQKRYSYLPFIIGVIMGIATLVRVANVFNIVGYILIFLFFFSPKLKNIFLFILGVTVIMLPYELFCFLNYGEFYPQYLKAPFGHAIIYGGYYTEDVHPLHSNLKLTLLGFIYILFATSLPKIKTFFSILHEYLGGFLWLGGIGIYEFFRRKKTFPSEVISVFLVGAVNLIFYSFSLWWDPNIEYYRYIIIPYITFLVSFIFLIDRILILDKKFKNFFIVVVFFILFLNSGYGRIKTNYLCIIKHKEIHNEQMRIKKILNWLNQHTKPYDVVATPEFYHAFPLDCVIVAFPQGRVMTKKNMNKFLEIYRPKYIWLKKEKEAIFLPFLDKYKKENLPPSLSSFYSVFCRKN